MGLVMNENEKDRIAAATNQLRPDWPVKSIRTSLDHPFLSERPRRDVAVALAWVACERDSKTPARVLEAGPWWRATASEGAPEERRWAPPKAEEACGKHPGEWRDRCRVCPVESIAAYHDADEPWRQDRHPDRVAALSTARAVMASKRAGLCRHGASVCHECEKALVTTTTTTEAAPAGEDDQP